MTVSSDTGSAAAPAPIDLRGKRVWVAGHRGMVGSALCRRLSTEACEILTVDRRTVDLTDQAATNAWVEQARPELVFVAAARVGGIIANATYPADFLYDNLMIAANIVHAAHRVGVEKLLYLGSSCIYPRETAQPIREEQLLTGALEPTNEPYAVAKIAGLKLAESYARQHGRRFVSALPTSLYGPNDNFDPETSHVLPALIRRFHEAKVAGLPAVTIWGSGRPRREFLHVDDLADACVLVMRRYDGRAPLNIGVGEDIAIADLAALVADITGYRGQILFDTTRPDGTPRKLLDVSRMSALGWSPRIDLRHGIADTYDRWLAAGGQGAEARRAASA
ncbi:GDP-L-fucose synthase family protein [Inquilinus sp.]|jgi:GDP-L-fucose synthase|uniref:GDP-L-fucose synthase family protein n=1 Tax=Inquilinus sp. TaxID=1932117 RepID=UPI0037834055